MNYSLSARDIDDLLQGKAKVMNYDKIKNCKTIFDVFYDKDSKELKKCVVLLYVFKLNGKTAYGHWNCLIMHGNIFPDAYNIPTIEFFDPYGNAMPDDFLTNVSAKIKKIFGQDRNYLSHLLRSQNEFEIEYNDHPLQEINDEITTCGRHVAVRCANANMQLEDYVKILKEIGNPDSIVLRLTQQIMEA